MLGLGPRAPRDEGDLRSGRQADREAASDHTSGRRIGSRLPDTCGLVRTARSRHRTARRARAHLRRRADGSRPGREGRRDPADAVPRPP